MAPRVNLCAGTAMRYWSAKGIMGTLGLWSSRVGMPGVAGSIAARRAHNLSASTSCRASLVIVGAAARWWFVMDDSSAAALQNGSEQPAADLVRHRSRRAGTGASTGWLVRSGRDSVKSGWERRTSASAGRSSCLAIAMTLLVVVQCGGVEPDDRFALVARRRSRLPVSVGAGSGPRPGRSGWTSLRDADVSFTT